MIKSTDDKSQDVVVIADAHVSPKRSNERMTWIGRYLSANPSDCVVSIGDFLSLDSLSRHQLPGSKEDLERPTFMDDISAGEEALYMFDKEAPSHTEVERHITLGNHEDRAHREAKARPKECGHFGLLIEQLYARYNFNVSAYGKFLFLGGVGFTHVPFNTMGVPYKGKNVEAAIARDTLFSVVLGHTHRHRIHHEAKIGSNQSVQVFNVGTSLPDGEVEHYAGLSATGWTYGICRLRVGEGKIIDHQMISMKTLKEKYS
ncbi:constituent protein [Rhizobium phage RHph_TM39]|uniref:Constituent protein n=2 Tax=Cuauhnahuacvirus TaxID=3044696 RepID=A0A7S5R853_9CAUD|nr:constituent protein [Rhizobium phage RHph_TM30]YP_010671472.1 constituent protein [Rhizobium phage RHph_Y65]QIG71795.1 constituent protein [Rhizobium phage RHph_TM40]QIG72156.1 constituent protein [Rhizobium phage RHph_TM2_3B]QIG72518.1 constituent protein [Rhizobium phage RHph_TM3_3_6]QIG77287.1 constituent protein [Rhizobium phage RHph_TM39]QIG77907.1 constituent protein [Rhizobium phage RHph_TM61]